MSTSACFLAAFCMLCLGSTGAVDNMQISVNPPVFTQGQTPYVTINCTFDKDQFSVYAGLSVTYIELYESSSNTLVSKIDIRNNPLQAQVVMSGIQLQTTGDINSQLGGYLATTWYNPVSTGYRMFFTCSAMLIGQPGQNIRINKTAPLDVTGTQPTYTNPPVTYTYKPATYTLKPITYTYAPVTYTQKPITYTQKPITYTYAPVTYTMKPVTYTLKPVTYTQKPVTYTMKPVTYTLKPVTYTQKPVSYTLPPVVTAPYVPPSTQKPVYIACQGIDVTQLRATILQQSKIIASQSQVINNITATCGIAPINPSIFQYQTNFPVQNPVTNNPFFQTQAPVTNAPVNFPIFTNAPVTQPPPVTAPLQPVTSGPVVLPINTGRIEQQSGVFQGSGHRYLLSSAFTSNELQGIALCKANGGYLAEIGTRTEYDFIVNFLSSTRFVEHVYIGIHYSAQAKDFYYPNSQGLVTFTEWDTTSMQPHPEGGRHCTVIIPGNNFLMSSTVCANSFNRRYLCEV